MKQRTILGISLALCLSTTAEVDNNSYGLDLLRFSEKANSDSLHGQFVAFDKSSNIVFKSSQAKETTTFSTKKLHRITLNKGRAAQALQPNSAISLINGDIIPGMITHADDKGVTLETQHLGELTFARNIITKISPTPHGGKLIYYGPMNDDGWKIISPPKKKIDEKEADAEQAKKKAQIEKNENNLTNWKFVAGSWYAGTSKERYLVRENVLPDTCKVKFKIGWRGSLYCNIGIHSDLDPPEYKGKESIKSNMASTLGRSYVVSLSSHSASLYSCLFDEEGKPSATRSENNHISTNLSKKEEAEIELRIDRPNKTLMLYIDGSFKTKWNLGEKYIAPGKAIAFKNLRYNNSQMRVSDILITRWNGMRDSAQSMQSDEHDVILLTNGVDRFSGTFKQIKDDKIYFRGTFDNELAIPKASVQEIYLASNKLRKVSDDKEGSFAHFYTRPYGRISGIPTADANGTTRIRSDIVSEVSLKMKFVGIVDFSEQNNLLDFWDDNF